MALSEDGNTALIGGLGDDELTGAAWVFTRSAGAWTQQGEKLTGTRRERGRRIRRGVALSADGDTALIGGPYDETGTGAAWVFTRSVAEVWSQQGEKLTGSGETGEGEFGDDVALSANGDTALIGGPEDNTAHGRGLGVHPLGRRVWTQQGAKLTGAARAEKANSARRRALRRRQHGADRRARGQHRGGRGLGRSPARSPGCGASRDRS